MLRPYATRYLKMKGRTSDVSGEPPINVVIVPSLVETAIRPGMPLALLAVDDSKRLPPAVHWRPLFFTSVKLVNWRGVELFISAMKMLLPTSPATPYLSTSNCISPSVIGWSARRKAIRELSGDHAGLKSHTPSLLPSMLIAFCDLDVDAGSSSHIFISEE